MKSFFVKCMLYLSICTVLIVTVNIWYLKMDPGDSITNKYAMMPDKISVCCFGSSHAQYGFDFGDYENVDRAFNFAMPAQPLSYDCRLADHYQKRFVGGWRI